MERIVRKAAESPASHDGANFAKRKLSGNDNLVALHVSM